jgi:hypothetical protein
VNGVTGAAEPSPRGAEPTRRLRTGVAAPVALATVGAAAEAWGGTWEPRDGGGLLHLPVQAGLRHGVLEVGVTATGLPAGGVELAFGVQDAAWRIHRTGVGLLVLAALGALAMVLWPFVPALSPLAPMGVVLGVAAWLVVLSRLRHHGLAELAEDVAERLEAHPAAGGSAPG